jgi:hypothetical protein
MGWVEDHIAFLESEFSNASECMSRINVRYDSMVLERDQHRTHANAIDLVLRQIDGIPASEAHALRLEWDAAQAKIALCDAQIWAKQSEIHELTSKMRDQSKLHAALVILRELKA